MASGFIRRVERAGKRAAYKACFGYSDPATGARKQRSKTFETRREAASQVAEWQLDAEAGTLVDRSDQTVAEFLRYWLAEHVQPNRRPNTYEQYKGHVENHIIPAIGGVKLQAVTPVTVQRMGEQLRKAGVGQTTIRCCHDRFSQAMKLAVRLGLIGRNPCDMIDRPALPHSERKTWTIQDLSRFLEQARESSYGPIFLLMAATGMRRGEALGLRWKDVDWGHQCIHIRQAVVMVGGAPVIGPTKSRSGQRTVPLSAEMGNLLRRHCDGQRGQMGALSIWHDLDLVFAAKNGNPINARNLDRQYRRLIERADVPHIPMHGLRHTFATLAIAHGEDVRTLSDILGHSRTSVTTDIYGHVTPRRKVELTDNMSDLILGGNQHGSDK